MLDGFEESDGKELGIMTESKDGRGDYADNVEQIVVDGQHDDHLVAPVRDARSKQTAVDGDPRSNGTRHNMPPVPVLPQAVMSNMSDESLKNLMMSWYYAGYYTGLHEGEQKAYANIEAQQGQSKNAG